MRYRIATPLFCLLSFSVAEQRPINPESHLHETQSPYLRQHLDNPVNWYPWGEAAFKKARDENKPIFLSVGFSSCHWCHVMERESFMDPDIAQVLNEHYVSIKLDREERPDLDRIYMSYVQAATGSGGWPMSVWLTPELEPFFGGTYFPPEGRDGRPGFKEVLLRLSEVWAHNPRSIRMNARANVTNMQRQALLVQDASGRLTSEHVEAAVTRLKRRFDPEHGGFGGAPKFPRPMNLHLIHRVAWQDGKAREEILNLSLKTLRHMTDGGIHDQLGGGFHRYAVDAGWNQPHFEKMLYDQAQLAMVYLEAFQITGDDAFAETARETLDYVLTRLKSDEGAFYASESAESAETDSSGAVEGSFYLWEKDEIDQHLGAKADLFHLVYGISDEGNLRYDPRGQLSGKNVLSRRVSLAEASEQLQRPVAELAEQLRLAEQILFRVREERPHPRLDRKVLCSWNGLMISAFARGYRVLGEDRYRTAAKDAATFLRENLYEPETGTLLRSFLESPSAIEGFAADYALLIQGLLDLYEVTFDSRYLSWSEQLQHKQDALFRDASKGGYFDTKRTDTSVIIRMKEAYDGDLPSANSVSTMNLLRLSSMFGNTEWQEQASRIFECFSDRLINQPESIPYMIAALDFSLQKPVQIVIARQPGGNDAEALLQVVYESFRPNGIVLFADGGKGQAYLSEKNDIFQHFVPIDGKATAYVCRDYTCEKPTNDPVELRGQL